MALSFHKATRGKRYPIEIVSFADGDTVNVFMPCDCAVHSHAIILRIARIDSHEVKSINKNIALYYAKVLSEKYLMARGELILTKKHSDKYGRAVGDILINGELLSKTLVEMGFAWYVR